MNLLNKKNGIAHEAQRFYGGDVYLNCSHLKRIGFSEWVEIKYMIPTDKPVTCKNCLRYKNAD